jgi:hypothetical protein
MKSCKIQKQQLLSALQKGPLSTLEAREIEGIMHPGGRVLELRKDGYSIITHRSVEIDAAGQSHRVARYVLLNKRQEVQYETD